MELHFLGTGSGLPSKQRNVSSLAIRFLHRKSTQWLFDCGEATQHQLLYSPISLVKIDKIFITHMHGDHIFGLPGLLCSRAAQGATTPLTIYGPKEIKPFIEATLSLSKSYVSYEITYVATTEGVLFSDDTLTVSAHLLDHVIPSYAYKIIEKDRPGTLDHEKLRKEGIEPGPIYKQLKNGEVVTLPDGRTLHGKDYVGAPKKGRVIVIAGDTRPLDELVSFADSADVLIHEGTFLSALENEANEYGHSTVASAAMIAKRANVKKLIITHISSRYANNEDVLLKEAKEHFPNSIIAKDMMVVRL